MLWTYEAQPSESTISTSKKMFFFRAEKGIACPIDASSVVWTLIDDGKLANQIARVLKIVVKWTIEGDCC